ncbi:ATP-binding protein [Rhodoferax saidenbachensis]|uniref:histidine kinase n=1 Tax=Rhodoferax saidenbachensis TaxID=1484693 RepID=A0ABU1ZKY4_9BURK|nr:ATP-binding protein [Rhodoferax saidenbachensis]MDR7306212.1 signal transduction histidine kinase [Rhodoferax saidenbachensis]
MGLSLPKSLRSQFILAVAALATLVLAGGVTAVYALHVNTNATRLLVEKRLGQMQDAQNLVRSTLLIEREAYQLATAVSVADMRDSYADILKHLESFDHTIDRLAATDDDIGVLDLHQSSQLFRNTVNIVGQLREGALKAAGASSPNNAESEQQFHTELREQAGQMVETTQAQSDRVTQEYREAMLALAETSQKNQRWVTVLLSASLLLAWAVAQSFLGKHVLARLELVSESLRKTEIGEGSFVVPVRGQDEIGAMARAVEQFQEDRRQLALANAALLVEKTRQEELIRKLAQAHSQLLQSEKLASIGQLAAGVAHEINNPVAFVNSNLGTLQGYVEDLFKTLAAYEQSEKEMSPATQKAMRDLKQQIDIVYLREDMSSLLAESMSGLQRVKRIVQDLRNFSHVDATDKQWANLEAGLDSTLNVVWSALKDKVEVQKEYGAIPEIECIPSQINQVFMNLLINAGQAIEGRGVVTLRTGYDSTHIWVDVQDTGGGIPPENLDRIFDPFFTTKPVGTGTGLGLSIAYGIVSRHGGRIEVKSEPGKGATFRVLLPRQTVVAPAETHSEAV